MTKRLEGKVAIVTGAARGQGRAHCLRLAEEGADVVAVDICAPLSSVNSFAPSRSEELAETVALAQQFGGRVVSYEADVRDLDAMTRIVDHTVRDFGSVDTVVANAAIVRWSTAWEFSESEWREIVDVNLTGSWITARAAIPRMIEANRGGSITFIGSAAATKGFAKVAPYVAAKHALVGLTKTLALEAGPHSIRVNMVNPSNVDTPMIQHPTMWKLYVPDEESPTPERIASAMAEANVLPVPWIESVDVSNAVVFLASDEARYITGAILPVDAGMTVK